MKKLNEIKNWNVEIEKEITKNWKDGELFNFDKEKALKNPKKIYSIDTPPPYVNSPIHIAQAVTYCFMDMIARYRRMKGFEVIFPLGLDRNGLPIEMAAEKKFKVSPFSVGRKKFVKLCEELINQGSEGTKESFAQLGISFTSYLENENIGSVYETDSEEYRKLTQATFIDLFEKGMVYEDLRINNWDPKLQTTIADSEIDYENRESNFNYVKWKVKETGEEIIIGTTRPELICTCGMVIFNPEDKRYKHLHGKTAITPIFEKEVKIKAHSLADIEKGTGIVMMCSAGDLSDIQFFREENLEPVIAINKDGRMNENAGFLAGLKVREAREKIVEELKEKNLLDKQEKITHRTPISERSKAEVEFIEMPEWYLKQLGIKDKIRKLADKINFFPESSKKILLDWIDSISIDWPISRRRFYATEIPLWFAYESKEDEKKNKKLIALPKQGKYYQPWKQEVPLDAEVWKAGKKTGKKVKDFKGLKWFGEERVFDTWMDSSISDLFILKYKQDDDFFEKSYPASLRPQGKEIVRTWLYYTILRGYLETGKACFKDVWIHQHLLDEKGRKMSKSLGNVVDPKEVIAQSGAEAIRFWAATEGDLSKQDLSVSKERIAAERKTLNKLLNVSKFILRFEKPSKKPKLTKLDELFVDFVEDLTEFCDKGYEIYDFNHPSQKLRYFLWETFASNYIELVKARAYNQDEKFSEGESNSARWSLYYILERFLHLAYPIIPQVSFVIGEELGLNLLKSEWPKSKKISNDLALVEKILDFNRAVWKKKKDKGISLKDSIKGIKIPKELINFEKDLTVTHGLE